VGEELLEGLDGASDHGGLANVGSPTRYRGVRRRD